VTIGLVPSTDNNPKAEISLGNWPKMHSRARIMKTLEFAAAARRNAPDITRRSPDAADLQVAAEGPSKPITSATIQREAGQSGYFDFDRLRLA
jgi:hypothetical protein